MPDEAPSAQQEELAIPQTSLDSKTPPHSIHVTSNTQNNFLVNLPPDVTLPPAEEFNKYSQDVRTFLLEGAKSEQQARHRWIDNEQEIRRQDWNGQRNNKTLSMILGTVLALFAMGSGTYLIATDKPITGSVWVFISVAWLIASAIYGFRPPALVSNSPDPNETSEDNSEDTN